MAKDKSSISKAKSYEEIGAFWDDHDLADYWDRTEPVEFEVDIESEVTCYALPDDLSKRLREKARDQGVSPQELLNLWVNEKLQEN